MFPTLYACHPELMDAFKNGKDLQKFADNWMKDESKFKERREWNRQHESKIEKEWEKIHGKSGEMTIEKSLSANKNLN